MHRKNFIKEKLDQGQAVLGTWAIIPSPTTIDIIGSTGLDFIIIDAEHGPISFETAQTMAMACEARQVSPIMRIGDLHPSDALKALDCGMHGLQVPNVESARETSQVVSMAKYPPLGTRGYSPFTRAGNYSLETAKEHTSVSNENTLVAINIEGEEALLAIDPILEVEGLDIIFIGLFDLSKALGIPGQVNHPLVLQHLETMTRRIEDAGKVAGTIATSEETMSRFLSMGLRYMVYLVDCEILRASYQSIHTAFKRESHALHCHH